MLIKSTAGMQRNIAFIGSFEEFFDASHEMLLSDFIDIIFCVGHFKWPLNESEYIKSISAAEWMHFL